MSRPPRIAFVATECFPFVKVGGLADVIGSLPRALGALGARVDVVLPAFVPGTSAVPPEDLPHAADLPRLPVPGGPVSQVGAAALPGSDVRVFLIGDGDYFPRTGVYVDPETGRDYPDQAARWAFFQQAALALLERERPIVDVIHCHEHQTALIPVYLESLFRPRGLFRDAATVLTIHNLGYQGVFPPGALPRTGLPDSLFLPGGQLEFYGQLNLMKCGILTADALTVVSPTYSREILTPEYGCGLDGVILEREPDVFGILNGIDEAEWDPRTDRLIGQPYSLADPGGKRANRRELLAALDLGDAPGAGPLLVMVSRVDAHKGFDLLLRVLEDLLRENVRFVFVGTGDRAIQSDLARIADSHPDKAAVRFSFDDTLAHRVIAGADIFLMPSRYEPCGLTQMYAMRYGAVPIVRRTGGLADTVTEFDPATESGTGFLFSAYDAEDFRRAIDRALAAWSTPKWPAIMKNGMAADFGWAASAGRYMEAYDHALARRRT